MLDYYVSLSYLESNPDFPPKDGRRAWLEALAGVG